MNILSVFRASVPNNGTRNPFSGVAGYTTHFVVALPQIIGVLARGPKYCIFGHAIESRRRKRCISLHLDCPSPDSPNRPRGVLSNRGRRAFSLKD